MKPVDRRISKREHRSADNLLATGGSSRNGLTVDTSRSPAAVRNGTGPGPIPGRGGDAPQSLIPGSEDCVSPSIVADVPTSVAEARRQFERIAAAAAACSPSSSGGAMPAYMAVPLSATTAQAGHNLFKSGSSGAARPMSPAASTASTLFRRKSLARPVLAASPANNNQGSPLSATTALPSSVPPSPSKTKLSNSLGRSPDVAGNRTSMGSPVQFPATDVVGSVKSGSSLQLEEPSGGSIGIPEQREPPSNVLRSPRNLVSANNIPAGSAPPASSHGPLPMLARSPIAGHATLSAQAPSSAPVDLMPSVTAMALSPTLPPPPPSMLSPSSVEFSTLSQSSDTGALVPPSGWPETASRGMTSPLPGRRRRRHSAYSQTSRTGSVTESETSTPTTASPHSSRSASVPPSPGLTRRAVSGPTVLALPAAVSATRSADWHHEHPTEESPTTAVAAPTSLLTHGQPPHLDLPLRHTNSASFEFGRYPQVQQHCGALAPGSGAYLLTRLEADGAAIEQYIVGNCIGRGNFGAVFRAINIDNHHTFAVKRFSITDKKQLVSIMKEVRKMESLDHPNVVKYYGYIQTDKDFNIILEYVENGSLASSLKNFGPLPEKVVALIVVKVLQGLMYLHERGLKHLDLKAANILTTKDGNVKLSDFGVSQSVHDTANDKFVGTAYWMAPEVITLEGSFTASDIWSLGCTIIELLTGYPPYVELLPMSALYKIVEDACPPLPDNISPELQNFLLCCFHKDPRQRWLASQLLVHPWVVKNVWIKGGAPVVPAPLVPGLSGSAPSAPLANHRGYGRGERPSSMPAIKRPAPPPPTTPPASAAMISPPTSQMAWSDKEPRALLNLHPGDEREKFVHTGSHEDLRSFSFGDRTTGNPMERSLSQSYARTRTASPLRIAGNGAAVSRSVSPVPVANGRATLRAVEDPGHDDSFVVPNSAPPTPPLPSDLAQGGLSHRWIKASFADCLDCRQCAQKIRKGRLCQECCTVVCKECSLGVSSRSICNAASLKYSISGKTEMNRGRRARPPLYFVSALTTQSAADLSASEPSATTFSTSLPQMTSDVASPSNDSLETGARRRPSLLAKRKLALLRSPSGHASSAAAPTYTLPHQRKPTAARDDCLIM